MSHSASASPSVGAPTDNYDVELFTDSGEDLLQTLGRNRDMATTEITPIVYSGTGLHPYVDEVDALTLRITGNVAPSATVVVDVFYALGA